MKDLEELYSNIDELYDDFTGEQKEPNTPIAPAGKNLILEAAKKLKEDAEKIAAKENKPKLKFNPPKIKKSKSDDNQIILSLIKENRRKEMAELKNLQKLKKQEDLKAQKMESFRKKNAGEAVKAFGNFKRDLKKEEGRDVIKSILNTGNNKLSTTDPERIRRKELIGDKFKIYNIISSRLLSNKNGNLNVEINDGSFTPSLDEVARNKGVLISKGSYKDGMKQIIRPQASTAVQSVTYDPKTNTAWLTFVGGNKAYAYDVSPYELEQFANAGSKGRWVNKVWKIHNRKEGY